MDAYESLENGGIEPQGGWLFEGHRAEIYWPFKSLPLEIYNNSCDFQGGITHKVNAKVNIFYGLSLCSTI